MILFTACAAAIAIGAARAQTPQESQKSQTPPESQTPPTPTPPPPAPTPPTPTISQRDNVQSEMRELFAKVERRLIEIDRLLSDAGAGDAPLPSGSKKAGIDELLRTSQTRQREVLESIDRILELARENAGRSSSSGNGNSGDPQSGGQSPLDKRGDQENEREATPSAPQPNAKPESQDQGGSKPKPDKPQKQPNGGDDPRDPRASPSKNAQNKPGAAPPGQPTEGPSKADAGKDRWGDLPVKVRDVFRTEGGSDMPVQYREWIDSYYRRLNKKP
jgi:hypothetical protein